MFESIGGANLSALSFLFVVGMALSLGNINNVFRKARGESRSAGVAEAIRGLSLHMQQIGNPDLQLVEFTGLETADKVVADVGCRLYALYCRKPTASTVNSWLKGSNHASAAAANGDIGVVLQGTGGGGRSYCPIFHDGLLLATGLTLGAHTTVNGSSKSLVADAPTGFAIIGAA
jgi:hypothetical protein